MTVTSAISELRGRWASVDGAASTLQLTVCEDAPTSDADRQPPPVEVAEGLALQIRAVLAAANARLASLQTDGESDEAHAVVGFIQDRRLEAERDLGNFGGVDQLLALARECEDRDGEWLGWWDSVARGLEELRATLRDADVALAACWREFGEHPHVRLGSATVGRLYVEGQAKRQEALEWHC